jgi:flagellar hook-associated protein 1 FlgK
MGLLGPSFQIGRSALTSYQAALAITGQNIANVGNPDYARQSGRLTALVGGPVAGVTPGAGVGLFRLRRHVDEALEARLRYASAQKAKAEQIHSSLTQTEALYNELSDQDVSSLLSEFFGGFGGVQTTPTDMTARDLVVNAGDGISKTMHRMREGLVQQVRDLNDQAVAVANHANDLSNEIADLNKQIVTAESDGRTIASPLRDQRDSALRELGELMDITTREQPGGSVNVYVNSEPLVDFGRSRGITVARELRDGLEIASVRFADDNGPITVREGKLAGLLAARDTHIRDQLDRMDNLARGLIYEVNRIHSQGTGLIGYESVTSEHAVLDPGAILNSTAAGLDFPVNNGTFEIRVHDRTTGAITTRQIDVDLDGLGGNDTTLASLAAQLNTVPGVTASVTADNRLQISAAPGSDISFGNDSSGALAALGVGGFFKGSDAATIDVADAIKNDPRLIAASLSGQSNDGDNAGRIAELASTTQTSALLGGRSIGDYHSDMVGDLAVTAHGALSTFEATDAVHQGLVAQREAISGVSLDEEAINLTKYERAFQGAARYIDVLNQMTDEVLRLL